jgi:uncharacterized protein
LTSTKVIIIFVIWLLAPFISSAEEEPPLLRQRVTDLTNTLTSNQIYSLESTLREYEDSTTNQIAVLLVGSVTGGSIEEFAVRVFEKNRLGQRGKDNGVLLLIAKDDRAIRIEVGYGLEGVLTDAVASRIIQRQIIPKFREGNYFEGIQAGVGAIILAIGGEYEATTKGDEAPVIATFLVFAAMLFFFGFMLPFMAGRRRAVIGSGRHWYYAGWGSMSGWGGSGWSSGGWGGGGWSGGGGLSGGGGATGRW